MILQFLTNLVTCGARQATACTCTTQEETGHACMCRYDNVNGSDVYGNPVLEIPPEVLESITRNGVRVLPLTQFVVHQAIGTQAVHSPACVLGRQHHWLRSCEMHWVYLREYWRM